MRYAIVLLVLGFITPVFAQQPIFKNYTVNDGLIANSIRRIFQDSKGFLWIATWEGLSKYDGHTFTNYSTANGLSHNMVNDFYESKSGRLYVALNNGSMDMIVDNELIRDTASPVKVVNRFTYIPRHPVVATTDFNGVQEFVDGKLIQPKQTFPINTYFDIKWLNDSIFTVIGDSYIAAFNEKYELVAEVRFQATETTSESSKLFQDSKKRIWVGTNVGLKLAAINRRNAALLLLTLPPAFNIPALQNKVNDIFEDADGSIWFGTNGGLVLVRPDGTHQVITVNDGLASNIVNQIYEDREKNMWIGTEVGLSKLVTKSSIRLYNMKNGVWTNDNLYLLYPFKKNHFLVSSQTGAQVFNKLTGEFSQVPRKINDHYFNVVTRSNSALLIGTEKVVKLDSTNLGNSNIDSLPLKYLFRIISDESGNFFLSNMRHLFFSDGKTLQELLNYRISSLLISKKGDLWAATWENGLFRIRYRIENNKFRILAKDHYLPKEKIRSLYEDSKGNIWVGTRYQGVYQLSGTGNESFTISNYDQSKGLSSNFVKGIREDAKGNLWIAFYQGLDKLIPGANGFRIFNFSKVNNYYVSNIGIEIDADHSLWLATGDGLVHIKDGELENLPPLAVYITKVSSPNLVHPLNTTKIELSHRQNQLQFEFSSPGFINEKQVLYSYRLSRGSTMEWTEASNQHVVSYASLQPGSYLFEVRNKGWDESWGEITAFAFVISPPFWQSWWFIALCILAIGFLVYILVRRRIKGIRHEAEMKQKISETEMMALRAQMNPHFIFNCLNSIDNLIQTDQKEKATDYLAKFAQLIRAILENSKNNTIPCWKDLEALELYLEMEKLRWDNKISCTLTIDSNIQQGDYKVPPMVVQPFIENAIHHGLLNKVNADKKLDIEVHVEDSNIKYTITDNGVGRLKAAEYKKINKPSQVSFGMQITKDRIDLFNQNNNGSVKITDLYNAQNLPEGTKVEVWLTTQPVST